MKSATPISTQIPALIEELTERYGDRLAIVGGEQRLTYRQLQVKVQEAASGLYALGIRPKDHVAILMGNKPEWIISFLAVQCLGATAVCLNTWSTPRELEYTIAHAEIKCLIAVSQFRKYNYQEMLSNMQPHRERLPHLQKIVWLPELGHQLQLNANELDWQTLIEGGSVKADAEIAAGKYRGLLHGIPYGLKDLFAVKGTKTTWGAAPYKNQNIDECIKTNIFCNSFFYLLQITLQKNQIYYY